MNSKRRFSLHLIFVGLFCVMISATETKAIESDLGIANKWSGDFDGMTERHLIRALVPPSKTFYFLDGADQRGLIYELLKEFETYLNIEFQRKNLKIKVVVIPPRRDRLLPALVEGLGDIAAGNLTITPVRQKKVDFSAPHMTGVDEIVISGSASPAIKTIDDLSRKEIHVRKSSSYYESLLQLNARFKNSGKTPVKIVPADEYLEDEDLLEMMDVGLIPMIVIDNHKAEFWSQVFQKLWLHPDIKLRSGGQIAWADTAAALDSSTSLFHLTTLASDAAFCLNNVKLRWYSFLQRRKLFGSSLYGLDLFSIFWRLDRFVRKLIIIVWQVNYDFDARIR